MRVHPFWSVDPIVRIVGPQHVVRAYRVIVVGTLVVLVIQSAVLFKLQLKVEFARDQVRILERLSNHAGNRDSEFAVSCLVSAIQYYPPGTKQQAGTALNEIVERSRALAVARIIQQLRVSTGVDLGEDPDEWILAYGSIEAKRHVTDD